MSLKQKVLLPGGRRSGQIFEIFVILGGAGDIKNSISTANCCDGPCIRLLPYPRKVFSAWTQVSSGTCRSSRRFYFPEVVVLDRFFEDFSDPGRGW